MENIHNNQNIDILLSVFNGEKYLEELLISLENQTYKNWTLYIRDDGSTDNSFNIITEFKSRNKNKVIVFKDRNIGVIKSFEFLINKSTSEYVFFCDQDDIWLEDKVSQMLKKLKELETEQKVPTLVFSDMIIIDENSKIKTNSFWKYHGINPKHNTTNRLLIQNVVTGCASAINKSLIIQLKKIPKDIIMHDWWIALCASLIGKIDYINKPTLKYRIHNDNQIGAKTVSIKRAWEEGLIKSLKRPNEIYSNTCKQAVELLHFMEENKIENNKSIVLDYINLKNRQFLKRLNVIIKRKFYFSSKIRTLFFILFFKP
jgi:glycosyltransferase involved in cell wall biosynthesis